MLTGNEGGKMRRNKKYSTLNIAQFGYICRKRAYTKYVWNDLRRNVRHVIESSNVYELDFFYHEAEKNLKVLQGAFSVLPNDNEAFEYTLDLSMLILKIRFKAGDNIKREVEK